MSTTHQHTEWTHLSHTDETSGYQVVTKEGDRFLISFDDLANACRINTQNKDFLAQFTEVFHLLNSWLSERATKLDRAYLSFGSDGIDFTVIQKSCEIDREFDRSLIDLDVEIAKDERYNLVRLDVLSLPYSPEESIRSFVRTSGTMKRQFE